YEALTKLRPFCEPDENLDDPEVLLKYQERLFGRERPASIRTLNPTVSAELEEVVFRGLHSDREKRFPTVKAFVDALTRVPHAGVALRVASEVPSSTQMAFSVETQRRPRRGRWSLGFALAGAAALTVAIIGIEGWRANHGAPGVAQRSPVDTA